MKLIKIKNGSIHLEHYMHNDDNNIISIGLYAISFTNFNNLINIESDCKITIKSSTVDIKTGKYTIEQFNKLINSLIISIVDKKIKIESPTYFNLNENLKKYLDFNDVNIEFKRMTSRPMIHYPNHNKYYINIEKYASLEWEGMDIFY